MKEKINLSQGKERTQIPQEVFEKIISKIKRDKTINITQITSDQIYNYLHELKMPEYYDHKEYITNKISGKISESIPRHVEEKLEKCLKTHKSRTRRVCQITERTFCRTHMFCTNVCN